MAFFAQVLNTCLHLLLKGLWRNGSASDSRSEGWEFESLWPHLFPLCSLYIYPHLHTELFWAEGPTSLCFGMFFGDWDASFFAIEETS